MHISWGFKAILKPIQVQYHPFNNMLSTCHLALLKALVNIVQIKKIWAACPFMLSEYLLGCENITLEFYHLMLKKVKNL